MFPVHGESVAYEDWRILAPETTPARRRRGCSYATTFNRFATMLLRRGELEKAFVFSPSDRELMDVQSPAGDVDLEEFAVTRSPRASIRCGLLICVSVVEDRRKKQVPRRGRTFLRGRPRSTALGRPRRGPDRQLSS